MTVSTPVQQHIRILDAQGVSWRRMAREVGVSRQTVGKYAELEDRSPKPPGHAKAKSKPDPFKPVIDKWLESDRVTPRVLVSDNATGAAHRVAWDKITIVDVFQRFVCFASIFLKQLGLVPFCWTRH